MPTPYIRKLASEGHGSVKTLEKHWDAAKARAAEEGKANNYPYIMGIFKKMSGINASVEALFEAELCAANGGSP